MIRRFFELAAQATFAAIILTVFFRVLPLTKFDAIPGDQGDVRLIIFILEHWWDVYRGNADWRSPPFFYPVEGTLGYADSLFLVSPFYSAFRAINIDMFASYQATLFVLGVIGYSGCLWLLRCVLSLNPVVSAVGAAAYMFSNGQLLALNHPQLLAGAAILPYLAIATLSYIRRLHGPPGRRWIIGAVWCLMFGLLAFSTFYAAWYFAFFLLTTGLVLGILVLLVTGIKPAIGTVKIWLLNNAWHIILLATLITAALVPFIITYAPIVSQFGGRSFGEVAEMLPSPADYLNVSYHNLMWGSVLQKMFPWLDDRPKFSELRYAITPVLMMVLLTGVGRAVINLTRFDVQDTRARELSLLSIVLGISVLFCLLAMVQINRLSLWYLIYELVPGAAAIRSVFRFNLALALPIVIVVSIFLSGLVSSRPIPMRIIGYSLSALIVIEQLNDHTPSFSKQEQRQRLALIGPHPPACRTFYLLPDPDRRVDWIWQQADAMLVGLQRNIPTMHGFSGWTPPRWDLRNPFAAHYPEAVADWTSLNGLPINSVCGLLQTKGRWFIGLTPLERKRERYPWRG